MTGPYSQGGFPEDQGPVYGAPNPYGYQQPLPPPSMYGFGDPYAPYGRHPVTGEPYSDKSKATAGLLQILLGFFGICGVGRLYIGSVGIGLCQLLGMFFALFMSAFLIGIPFAIGIWIWALVDGIVILSGNARDGARRPLRG
ncbi:TM2 domain-containing protein [Rhodococcus qingshengii]|uniref:TM2 domain-containing protein n=1 Tax=Rhodococcus qingshengii TaxID=334542 RepID=UPI001C5E0068|nr:TM2 domain-containing protein [Rhodococcus qingshengii]MBW4817593.1 TM2 domain-containing protein [Rhodococcus qingshengii]